MNSLILTPKFRKHYKLRVKKKEDLNRSLLETFTLLENGIIRKEMKDHALAGSMIGLRALSITSDCRILYKKTKAGFLLIDIGTHKQVYKK